MRRAQITLRLVIAVTLGWGLLWAVVAPAMAQSTPDPDLATVTVYKQYCEDDDRVGETDFLVGTSPFETDEASLPGGQAFQTTGTGDECALASGDDEVTFTLTNVETEDDFEQTTVSGIAVFANIDPGTYTLTEEGDEDVDDVTSDEFPIEAGTLDITVVNYIEEGPGEVVTPNPEGPPATVRVDKKFCTDESREGDVDFFVQEEIVFEPAATALDCRPAEAGEANFTLEGVDNGESYGPTETNAEGRADFALVEPGVYTLTENETEAESEPFEIFEAELPTTSRVDVVNYLGVPATETPDPTDAPKPTKTPTSGGGGQTPKPTNTPTSGGGGGVVNPPVVTQRTPIVTTPSRPVTTNRNCVNLTTAEAQALLDADPSDPNDLDRDGDGIACEDGESTTTTSGTVRTAPVVRSSPVSVTALPSTGEGTANGAPLGEFAFWLVAALAVIALGATMVRRRVG